MSKQGRKDRNKAQASHHLATEAMPAVSNGERNGMIAEAAYLIAERRGFLGDAALDDWLRAEAEVSARLSGGKQA